MAVKVSAVMSVENEVMELPVETAAEESRPNERPSERIKIGSQRDEPSAPVETAPKPTMPVTEHKPAEKTVKHYPPPNIRSELPPELEAELQAALGEQTIDQLMAGSAGETPVELAPESRVKGRVSKFHADNIFVDLGNHRQGVIAGKQFGDLPLPEEGAEIDLLVVRHNAEDGLYELSLPHAAVQIGNWDEVEVGQIVEVTVTGVNKGGLECQVANIRGFMPMGQISIYRVEQPEDYLNQKIACVVTEANRDRRNLVLSHRAVMERERAENREKLMASLTPGQVVEGTVRSLRDFGAFVDLGGVDGMIHVSKMSWARINHPSEVLAEGQAVKVKIERIDPETGKISLSYRDMGENPWDSAEKKYYVGVTVKGAVSKIMDFGAFVKLEPGVEGLIHISELAHGRVFRTGDVVSEGQAVETKVLSFDREKQRISLSLKALQAKPVKEEAKKEEEELPPEPATPVKRTSPANLKGGIGNPTGGDRFGLKW